MAYEVVMPYHLHMPSYFLETFTEYPFFIEMLKKYGRVAQLNRVADYGSAGYRFESCRGHSSFEAMKIWSRSSTE